MTEQSQSSIHMKFFHGGDILKKNLKIFKIFEKIKIAKEIMREKNVNREGWRLLYELPERKPG